MIILRDNFTIPDAEVTATTGFFDGLHCGHRFLLDQVKREARRRGTKAMAVTFARHPADVLCPGTAKPLLSTYEERIALIAAAGMDYCAVLDFTPALAALSASGFMEQYLRCRFNVSTLVVGYDHSFGHDKSCTFDDYRTMGAALGITLVKAEEYVGVDGLKISSTRIRRQLSEGCVETAAAMLGRRYAISGTVVGGRRVGRQIGFPTANVDVTTSGKIVPSAGVYMAIAEVDGTRWPAVVNIGTRPTLHNGNDTSVEAHLLNFNRDIYGHVLTLEFAARLRSEKRFDSLDALRAQIADDARRAAQMASALGLARGKTDNAASPADNAAMPDKSVASATTDAAAKPADAPQQ